MVEFESIFVNQLLARQQIVSSAISLIGDLGTAQRKQENKGDSTSPQRPAGLSKPDRVWSIVHHSPHLGAETSTTFPTKSGKGKKTCKLLSGSIALELLRLNASGQETTALQAGRGILDLRRSGGTINERRVRMKIETEYIKLDSFLKAANLVSSGGEAKILIADGMVRVNGECETRRGRKLHPGDMVELDGNILTVE